MRKMIAKLFGYSRTPIRNVSKKLQFETLERREVPAAGLTISTPLTVGSYAIGTGSGDTGQVAAYLPNGTLAASGQPFGSSFTSGVRVAVGDVDGDGTPDVIAAAGPGSAPTVKVYSGQTGSLINSYDAFESSFLGGVYVGAADLDGDGKAEVVATADEGGGPRVQVFAGASVAEGVSKPTVLDNFFAIDDKKFRGGVRLGLGDINGDGVADLVVSAGVGGGPRIAGYDGAALGRGEQIKLFNDFAAFEPGLRNGAFVAVGDLNGDGFGDLVFGAGPGGGPRIRAIDGQQLLNGKEIELANFFGGSTSSRNGVQVGTITNGDGTDNIVTADAATHTADLFRTTGERVRTLSIPSGSQGVTFGGTSRDQIATAPTPQGTTADLGKGATTAGGVRLPRTGTYTVSRILGFDSDRRYTSNNAARVAGMQLLLTSDGRFVLAVPDSIYGYFSGRYQVNSNGTISISGTRSYGFNTSSNVTAMDGIIGVVNGQTRMSISIRTGTTMAAVINNTGFSGSRSNWFQGLVALS